MSRTNYSGSQRHVNNDIMCVIGYRTLFKLHAVPLRENHLTELTLIPTDNQYSLNGKCSILSIKIRPDLPIEEVLHKENFLKRNYSDSRIKEMYSTFVPFEESFQWFQRWYDKLPLIHNKKLAITTHDMPVLHTLLVNWFGELTYEQFFRHEYNRDISSMIHYLNDIAEYKGSEYPFNFTKLVYVLRTANIEDRNVKSGLGMARAIMLMYRKMIMEPKFRLLK